MILRASGFAKYFLNYHTQSPYTSINHIQLELLLDCININVGNYIGGQTEFTDCKLKI